METRKTATLRNDFHNTEVRVRIGTMSRRNARRVALTLCPSMDHGCSCGRDALNTRMPEPIDVRQYSDGSVSVEVGR